MTKHVPVHRFYHKSPSEPYALENSLAGLVKARRLGMDWIDLDANWCWNNFHTKRVMINTHWGNAHTEGFTAKSAMFSRMTWRRVKKLTGHGGFKIHKMTDMIHHAGSMKINVELEAKSGKAFEKKKNWVAIKEAEKAAGNKVWVKTLDNLNGGHMAAFRRLKAAHEAGLTTMLLVHDKGSCHIPKEWQPYIDYVRGNFTLEK